MSNKNTVNTPVTFVREVIAVCAIHPADFCREVGKAENLKDNAKSVSLSKGTTIASIVKGAFAKGTHASVIERETARWESLSAISNALGLRLNALLRACDVETGNASGERLKALPEAEKQNA